MNGRAPQTSDRQRGAVLVLVAVMAPVMVAFLIYVFDVNNWLEHKRHLQVQADAAALSAAQNFQPCDNGQIYAVAGQYAGTLSVTTPSGQVSSAGSQLYNQQVGATPLANVHALVNSKTFYAQPTSPAPDDTVASDPCAAGMVDVKMTETNLPWYFHLPAPFHLPSAVPYINAEARVSIRQTTRFSGSLPVAVNDLNPQAAEAYFVDETASSNPQLMACGPSGTSPCSTPLTLTGTNNSGLAVWSNASAPLGLPITKPDIGVRVAITGRPTLTGNMVTDCAQSYVTCFDANTTGNVGVLHIQGYTGNGSGTAASPIARQVTLAPGPGTAGCSDGYFSAPASSCTVGVSATIAWGTTSRPSGADVDAVVGGTCYALTPPATFSSTEIWTSATAAPAGSCANFQTKSRAGTGYITLNGGTGSTQIDLQIKDSSATNSCAGGATSLCDVQRSYTADVPGGATHSGPVQAAFLTQVGGLPQDADSFRRCETGNTGSACTPNLIVTIDITGSLKDAQSTSDPVYTLRFDGTGSQNQSVTCTAANGGSTYADELASGCAGTWAINPTLTCPDTSSDCLTPATGNKQNQVANGLNQRILGSSKPTSCTNPNHWPSFTFTNGVPNVSASDPRAIDLFVTPYGSFSSNGSSSQYPIADFATFYVTGWQVSGNGFSNPCQGNGDDTAAPGTIVGHFIKYVNTLDTNDAGGGACAIASLDSCVAVLTK
jgi:Flp pilus assembly protein TadG